MQFIVLPSVINYSLLSLIGLKNNMVGNMKLEAVSENRGVVSVRRSTAER